MLKLRPYKPCDAEMILSWCCDEATFHKWTAGKLGSYPLTAEHMNSIYLNKNGNCPEPDNFFPMTAFDERGLAGHLIMRFTDAQHSVLRFGFVIVDDSRRGQGLGREMIGLAMRYAFEILKVNMVTLGVFENNPGALHCYLSAGFRENGQPHSYTLMGETWNCLELCVSRTQYEVCLNSTIA